MSKSGERNRRENSGGKLNLYKLSNLTTWGNSKSVTVYHLRERGTKSARRSHLKLYLDEKTIGSSWGKHSQNDSTHLEGNPSRRRMRDSSPVISYNVRLLALRRRPNEIVNSVHGVQEKERRGKLMVPKRRKL